MEYNSILNKQIKKLLPEQYTDDEIIKTFLASVSNSYNTFERANKVSEHAFTISEREYQEVNDYLHRENEIKQQSISEIKKAISSLAPDTVPELDNSGDDLIHVIKFLQGQIEKAKELENQLIESKELAERAA